MGYDLLQVEIYNALFIRKDLALAFPEAGTATIGERWALGWFCRPQTRLLWLREQVIIEEFGVDPRFWIDSSHSLAERGASIRGCLREFGNRYRDASFNFTW